VWMPRIDQAATVSEVTFDPTRAWRTLYMQRCDECDPALSTWEFVRP